MTALAPSSRACWPRGEPAALVQVAVARGSTPREAGAAHAGHRRRACIGTIGGGAARVRGDRPGARRCWRRRGASARSSMPLGPGDRPVLRRPRHARGCGAPTPPTLAALDGRAKRASATRLPQRAAVRRRPCRPGAGPRAGAAAAAACAGSTTAPTSSRTRRSRASSPSSPSGRCAEVEAAPRRQCRLPRPDPQPRARLRCSAEAVLRRGDFAYLGLIGSRTKRAPLRARLPRAAASRERARAPGLPDRRRPARATSGRR